MIDKTLLEEMYFKQCKTQREIAQILNMSQTYVSYQFIKLGIKSRRIWTKEDVEYLQEKFGILSLKIIAKHLGKTEYAIVGKAKRAGLGGVLNASELLNAAQLAKALGVDRGTIERWIKEVNLKAVKRVLSKKRAFWRIRIDDFWEWAKEHESLINWSKFEKNSMGKEPKWTDTSRKNYSSRPKRECEKWTNNENNALEMYWNAGKKVNEIADILNRTSGAIINKAEKLELKRRNIKIPWKPIEVETLIKMKIEGYTDVEVAEELGRGLEGVSFKRKMLIKSGELNWEYRKTTKVLDKATSVVKLKINSLSV